MSKKPREYVPKALRPVEPIAHERTVYGCGYENKPNSFGMFAGVFQLLQEALEVVPDEEDCNPCIIMFRKDGVQLILYRWNIENRCWRRED